MFKRNFTIDDVCEQMAVCASSPHVETILFTATDIRLLANDFTHPIVKRGCRDTDILELSEPVDYVLDTGDGSLDAWY